MGKSGVVDADGVSVSKLAGLTAGVLDVFSTHTLECEVHGIDSGAVIIASDGTEPIAGGFAGYADVSKIIDCHVDKLKQVSSDQIAGGFVGKTDMHYLINVSASSPLVQAVLGILDLLLRGLLLDDLSQINLLSLNLGIADLAVLQDGDLVYVNLLGLKVGVTLLSKELDPETGKYTGVALITIGDSYIELPYHDDHIDMDNENEEAVINLIKGNRTRVKGSTVEGLGAGYDVYGGGADGSEAGTHNKGYTGGFVGYNKEGHLLDNTMTYCDVVQGTPEKTGPFSGYTTLQSVYSFNTLQSIEGENNQYSVYRSTDLNYALTDEGQLIDGPSVIDTGTPITYQRFDITYLSDPISWTSGESYYEIFEKWKDGVLASDDQGTGAVPIEVYDSSSKAVLMLDIPTKANDESLVPDPGESQDPCEETLTLTIQKVWDDRNDMDGSRPDSIRVRLWQHFLDSDGTAVTEGGELKIILYLDDTVIPDMDENGWFTLTEAQHGRLDSAAWMRRIEGLPSLEYEKDPITGQIVVDPVTGLKSIEYYYTYTVEEEQVEGYSTEIVYYDQGLTAKITNTHRPVLPLTGGAGDWFLVICGAGFVLTALLGFRRKRTAAQAGDKIFRPPRGSPPLTHTEAIKLPINHKQRKEHEK